MTQDFKIYALTLYGEARGEIDKIGILGLQAVGLVIRNRLYAGNFGETLEQVCKKPYQFSCWNPGDPNLKLLEDPKTLEDKTFQVCTDVSHTLLRHRIQDFTRGATHYHAKGIAPYWTKDMTMTLLLGDHQFYG